MDFCVDVALFWRPGRAQWLGAVCLLAGAPQACVRTGGRWAPPDLKWHDPQPLSEGRCIVGQLLFACPCHDEGDGLDQGESGHEEGLQKLIGHEDGGGNGGLLMVFLALTVRGGRWWEVCLRRPWLPPLLRG